MPRPKQPRNVAKARRLRSHLSLPEALLWSLFRKQPAGVKFRRQHPLGPYVLDFYCAAPLIAIEIDGFAHDTGDRPLRDEARDAWLAAQGVTVIRIPAADVLQSPEDVAEALVRLCGR
mgnify:CR=1 FL=1